MKRLILLTLALLTAAGVFACRRSASAPHAASPRPRIASFSPAITAILFQMGLGDHVIGVTAWCDLPEGESRPVLGDRASPNVERILSAAPDVLLIQQNPSNFDAVRRGRGDIRIEHFTIETLDDIAAAVERIGEIAGKADVGREEARQFRADLDATRTRAAGLSRPRVLFLTAASPPAVAGRDSFIHEMIELAGGEDVTAEYERWTQINVEHIVSSRPDVIIAAASSGEADGVMQFLKGLPVAAAADGRLFVVTDRDWTIPSMRLAELTARLFDMIHPHSAEGD